MIAPVPFPMIVYSHYIADAHMPFHCDNRRLWKTSRTIMHDAVTSIAMFWQDLWLDFVG